MTLTEQFVKHPRLFSFSHIHPIYQAVKKVINSLSLAVSPAVTNLKNVHTISNCCLKIFSRVNWPIHSVDSRKTSTSPEVSACFSSTFTLFQWRLFFTSFSGGEKTAHFVQIVDFHGGKLMGKRWNNKIEVDGFVPFLFQDGQKVKNTWNKNVYPYISFGQLEVQTANLTLK